MPVVLSFPSGKVKTHSQLKPIMISRFPWLKQFFRLEKGPKNGFQAAEKETPEVKVPFYFWSRYCCIWILYRKGLIQQACMGQILYISQSPVFRTSSWPSSCCWALSPWNILPGKSFFLSLGLRALLYRFDQAVYASSAILMNTRFCCRGLESWVSLHDWFPIKTWIWSLRWAALMGSA